MAENTLPGSQQLCAGRRAAGTAVKLTSGTPTCLTEVLGFEHPLGSYPRLPVINAYPEGSSCVWISLPFKQAQTNFKVFFLKIKCLPDKFLSESNHTFVEINFSKCKTNLLKTQKHFLDVLLFTLTETLHSICCYLCVPRQWLVNWIPWVMKSWKHLKLSRFIQIKKNISK